jgi:hypothetical protein
MTAIGSKCRIGWLQKDGTVKHIGVFTKIEYADKTSAPAIELGRFAPSLEYIAVEPVSVSCAGWRVFLDRTPKIEAVLASLRSLRGVTEVRHCSIFEYDDSGAYWDAAWRFWLSFSASKKPDLWVSLDEHRNHHAVSIQQVQCARERGNRWLYKLGDARSAVVRAVAAALPDYQLATPDGDQKVDQILAQHGGFTVEELEEMNWEEWLDGKEVMPRLRRQYGRCPDGYRWGEAIGRRTRLLVKLTDPPGAHGTPPSCPPAV